MSSEGSTIWRGGTARPLGGKQVRWAVRAGDPWRGAQEERGGLSPVLPEQQPQRVGVLSWGPQHLRGLKLGVEEQGGVGPAVQEGVSEAPWWKAGATARVSNCSQAPRKGERRGPPSG